MILKGWVKVRKQALLDQFGSIEKLRNTKPEEIQKMEGIGPKIANKLHDFLSK